MTEARLPPKDLLAAAAVVVIWGSNFVVMKIGLQGIGPMLLAGLRFALAAFPLLLFVKPPALPARLVVGYGLAQGLGQFGFLFLGLALGLPAGVASIVLQMQAFFTVLLAAGLLGERVRGEQWLGLVASASGLLLILLSGGTATSHVPLAGFLCCVAAAAMWAVSNIVAVKARRSNPGFEPLALIVWSSAVPVLPFAALALWHEGPEATLHSLVNISGGSIAAIAFLVIASTLIAYSLWAQLLKRHPASRVAPFSLLVPVVGLLAAWWVFDERLAPLQWGGVALVGVGLVVGSFGGRLFRAA